MTESTPISLSGLTYRYPGGQTDALDIADLHVGEGVTLVTGASGSGKSSLLRVFNGLVPHFHGGTIGGRATVCGHDVITTATRVLACSVGFVFQDPELQSVYPTVERDVAFGLENLAVPAAAMPRRVGEALEKTGITHLRGRAVSTLSGGERQRLALAGVLAMQPRVLVLDEPLSQLDEDGGRSVVTILGTLAGDGTAVIIAEHRLDQLARLGGRALAMEGGHVVDVGGRGSGADGRHGRIPYPVLSCGAGCLGVKRCRNRPGAHSNPRGSLPRWAGRRGRRAHRPQRRRQDHPAPHHRRAARAPLR